MTTYSQLNQYAADCFTPAMRVRGFLHHKSFAYTRQNSCGIWHIVHSQITSSKANVRFHCHVWVSELALTPKTTPWKCNAIRAPFPSWGDAWGDWVDL